jgi:transposase
MRGADSYSESLFTTVRLEDFVPANHPMRPIRTWVNDALAKMDGKFSAMYEADVKGGRPSIAPEKLMRAMLLQVLYSVRSERQLVEQIQYNLLFRWFVGQGLEDEIWPRTTFAENRQRLVLSGAAGDFFARVLSGMAPRLIYNDHFSLNRSLIEEWSGQRSLDIDGRDD